MSALVLLLLTTAQTAQATPSANVLLAAQEKWKAETRFSASYEFFQAVTERGVDPLKAIEGSKPVARGVFVKDGVLSRYSKLYTAPPQVVERYKDRGASVKNMSWEAVFDDKLVVHYDHKWKNYCDRARYSVRADLVEGRARAEYEMSPVTPYAGDFEYLFGGRDARKQWTVKGSLGDRTILSRTAHKDTIRLEWDVEFWTQPQVPVVTAITARYFVDGKIAQTAKCELSEWVRCNGLMVARCVATMTNVTTANDRELALVRVWRSKDLKGKLPVRDPFVLTIPATTKIVGLHNAPAPGGERRLSVIGTELKDVMRAGSVRLR